MGQNAENFFSQFERKIFKPVLSHKLLAYHVIPSTNKAILDGEDIANTIYWIEK